MKQCFDVAIVGASLAGSSLAYRLGLQGFSIALFDTALFPRSKPCGEGLSSYAINLLGRLGLASELGSLAARPFHGYSIWPQNSIHFSIAGEHSGLGIERSELDQMLLSNAIGLSNVIPFLGESVEAIDSLNGLVSSAARTVSVKFIVLASGASGLAEKLLRRHSNNQIRRFGISFHAEGGRPFPSEHVEIFPFPDGQLFCTPLPKNRLNISWLGFRGKADGQIMRRVKNDIIPSALERLGWDAKHISAARGAVLTQARRGMLASSRLLCIGDAREQLDPVGGMGMSHALHSAEFASTGITKALHGIQTPEAALKLSAQECELATRPLRAFTKLTYHILVHGLRLPIVNRVARSALAARMSQAIHSSDSSYRVDRKALAFIGACL